MELVNTQVLIDRADTEDEYALEIQHEAGMPGKLKLYIHNCKLGITIVRICKFDASRITIPEDVVPYIQLS